MKYQASLQKRLVFETTKRLKRLNDGVPKTGKRINKHHHIVKETANGVKAKGICQQRKRLFPH